MKKILIPLFMLLPLTTLQAQSVLTPQQQLEEAQKKLEEAQKAVEQAKQAKLQAEKAAEQAKAKTAEEAKKKAEEAATKAQAEKIQQQIKAAEAEAERLKAEAAKLNAEAEKAGAAQKEAEQKQDKKEAQKEAKEAQGSNPSGWYIPTTPAKTEKKADKAAVPTTKNGAKLKEDPKYLEGAVTTNDEGKVVFEQNIEAKGKTAAQLYDIVYEYMVQLTQEKNSKGSRVALINKDEHVIANAMDEWLVFSRSFISLDRSEAKYNLIATITDGNVKMTINHINYVYEEGRSTGFKASAENVITDKMALTKKKNDLARLYGKFRKKTIDRKDQIFNGLAALVK